MHSPVASLISICLILSFCLVSGSSVLVIVFEQSDRTVLIPEAIIYADGKITGKTDINGAFNLSFEGYPPLIRVAKGGYTDWSGSPADNDTAVLVPLQVRNSTLHIEVFDADTLTPVSDALIVAIGEDSSRHEAHSGPDGTAEMALRADQVYNVEINGKNFQTAHDTVVTASDSSTVQYSLVRNDRISIRVSDAVGVYPIASAAVQIDGAIAGATNDRGVLISNTSRNVEHIFDISAEGYDPLHIARTISYEDQVVDFPLSKAKSTVFISVYDKNERPIPNATISTDGSSSGETNEFGRLMISSLEMKPYEFSATHEGFKKNSVQYTPGTETSEVIIVLESEFTDHEVLVTDSRGMPLSDVSLYLLGENQETLSNSMTGSNGTSIIPINEDMSYRVKAEKGGYYPNSTSVSREGNQTHLILHTPATANAGSQEFPWLFIGIGILIVLGAGAGLFILKNQNKRPRRRGRSNRRRSL